LTAILTDLENVVILVAFTLVLLFCPRTMETYSWKAVGVPDEAAWEVDDTTDVILTTKLGDVHFVLYPKAAPRSVEAFKRGLESDLYSDCTLTGIGISLGIRCNPPGAGKPIDTVPTEWLHAPLKGTVSMVPVSDNESNTFSFEVSLNDEAADFLAQGGNSKQGYSVFMKVVDGFNVLKRCAHQKNVQGHFHTKLTHKSS